jgi:hypothetical protein
MERFLPPTREELAESVTLAHMSADDVERRVIAAQRDDIWLDKVRAGARDPQTKRRQEFCADEGVFDLLEEGRERGFMCRTQNSGNC